MNSFFKFLNKCSVRLTKPVFDVVFKSSSNYESILDVYNQSNEELNILLSNYGQERNLKENVERFLQKRDSKFSEKTMSNLEDKIVKEQNVFERSGISKQKENSIRKCTSARVETSNEPITLKLTEENKSKLQISNLSVRENTFGKVWNILINFSRPKNHEVAERNLPSNKNDKSTPLQFYETMQSIFDSIWVKKQPHLELASCYDEEMAKLLQVNKATFDETERILNFARLRKEKRNSFSKRCTKAIHTNTKKLCNMKYKPNFWKNESWTKLWQVNKKAFDDMERLLNFVKILHLSDTKIKEANDVSSEYPVHPFLPQSVPNKSGWSKDQMYPGSVDEFRKIIGRYRMKKKVL